jgi:hypothetical protein
MSQFKKYLQIIQETNYDYKDVDYYAIIQRPEKRGQYENYENVELINDNKKNFELIDIEGAYLSEFLDKFINFGSTNYNVFLEKTGAFVDFVESHDFKIDSKKVEVAEDDNFIYILVYIKPSSKGNTFVLKIKKERERIRNKGRQYVTI